VPGVIGPQASFVRAVEEKLLLNGFSLSFMIITSSLIIEHNYYIINKLFVFLAFVNFQNTLTAVKEYRSNENRCGIASKINAS